MQAGERVRYSRAFLSSLKNESLRHALAEMEGTILAIDGDEAQVDFGSRFRATSKVNLENLENMKGDSNG